MPLLLLPLLFLVSLLVGCEGASTPAGDAEALPPFVKLVSVSAGGESLLGLSGTVRARAESPLAFQVGGRIARRAVDAGQSVSAGQLLFELDQRDLKQSLQSAEADLAGADAALATADAEVKRHHRMREKGFTSEQELERAELAQREAKTQRDAARARLVLARNALGYGRLEAPAAGVLTEVSGESGQVVAAGQIVTILAHSGGREIEVYFPDGVTPPAEGEALLADGVVVPLSLHETAGAVDPQGRTLRARYTVLERADTLILGAVVRTRFVRSQAPLGTFSVPIAAIDERAQGPHVWRFHDGVVTPVPVSVLETDGEHLLIRGPLAEGESVVALGTHLLHEGMRVRELDR